MVTQNPENDDEVARERDEVIKRMLATPPQPKTRPPKDSKRGQPKKKD